MEDLSIIIPTYNRKERLLKQLESILSQELAKKISIVVLDNHSNYDVEQAIREKFDTESIKNLNVIVNRANVGLSMNISLPFFRCKTKWLWILSDDDVTLPNSLEIIINDIHKYDDYAALKYSVSGMSNHNNQTIITLEDLISYYERKDKNQGEFIFISNNLFNISKLEPFLGHIVNYSYNAVAGILPYVYILDAKQGKIILRSDEVVKYLPPQAGKEWNYIDITTRLITLIDYPFKSCGKTVRRLMFLMNHFSFIAYLDGLISLKDRDKAKMYYEKTFYLLFRNGYLLRALYRGMFYSYYIFGLNSVKLVRNLKRTFIR